KLRDRCGEGGEPVVEGVGDVVHAALHRLPPSGFDPAPDHPVREAEGQCLTAGDDAGGAIPDPFPAADVGDVDHDLTMPELVGDVKGVAWAVRYDRELERVLYRGGTAEPQVRRILWPGWRNRSDAEVLNTSVPKRTCGFDSHPGHRERPGSRPRRRDAGRSWSQDGHGRG